MKRIEKVLEELDGIFKGRDRTLEVLLGSWLESILPEQIESHSLEKANTLSKLCNMFLAWRSEEKAKSLNGTVGDEDKAPAKLSAKAMQRLEILGLLRSDLPDDISNDEVLEMNAWNAGGFKAKRFASEGNIEELVPFAKARLMALGATENDLGIIDSLGASAKEDELNCCSIAHYILTLLFYAEIRILKDKLRSGQDLFDCAGLTAAIKIKQYSRKWARDERELANAEPMIHKLRSKFKKQGKLDNSEKGRLCELETRRDGILAKRTAEEQCLMKRLRENI